MRGMERVSGVLLILAFATSGAACGAPEEGAGEPVIAAEAQSLILDHKPPPAPPVTVFGRITEIDLPPASSGGSLFPEAITVGRDGDPWFRIFSAAQLGHLSRRDDQLSLVPIPSNGNGIARGADGNIWFGIATGIGKLERSGVAHLERRREVHRLELAGDGLGNLAAAMACVHAP